MRSIRELMRWAHSLRRRWCSLEGPDRWSSANKEATVGVSFARVVHLIDDPDELNSATVYAIGENGHLWHVTFLCPCGCGARISLNLLPDDSPRWRLEERSDGPTLFPSVWRTAGCRSHFILRRGRVLWCSDEDSW